MKMGKKLTFTNFGIQAGYIEGPTGGMLSPFNWSPRWTYPIRSARHFSSLSLNGQ
jgi:hypothetical protein